MSGTTLEYNGVTLKDGIVRVSQSIEYDDSGTDKIFDRMMVKFSGSVHADLTHFHGVYYSPSVSGTPATAVDAMTVIQKQLEQPRGSLKLSIGGQVLLAANANSSSPFLDVNNGPKPKVLSINRVVGQSLFEIEFEVEVCRVLCGVTTNSFPSYGAKGNAAVLNNRWSISDERDGNFYSVRTLEGTLRVSHVSAFPHLLRYLCVPPLQRGYRRESMRFVDDPSGLVLKYQVVDRQKYAAPPKPATDWEATYVESSGLGGAMAVGEMNVKLVGAPGSSKIDLVKAATAVVASRLGALQRTAQQQGQGENSVTPLHAAVIEHLHDNVVQVIVRIQRANANTSWLHVALDNIDNPIAIAGYDPDEWPVSRPFDDGAPHGLFAKYLQSPCVDIHGIPLVTQGTTDENDASTDDSPMVKQLFTSDADLTFDDNTGVSNEQKLGGFPFVYVMLENKYDMQDGVIRLPVARWGGSSVPAAPQPSCLVIPIHAPIGKRTITAHCERIGAWPTLPSQLETFVDVNGITHQRLWRKLITEAPTILADGKSKLYKVQYKLDYAMDRAPLDAEFFAGGSTPINEELPADNRLDGTEVFGSGDLFV